MATLVFIMSKYRGFKRQCFSYFCPTTFCKCQGYMNDNNKQTKKKIQPSGSAPVCKL